jgi:hypothetical protein
MKKNDNGAQKNNLVMVLCALVANIHYCHMPKDN